MNVLTKWVMLHQSECLWMCDIYVGLSKSFIDTILFNNAEKRMCGVFLIVEFQVKSTVSMH